MIGTSGLGADTYAEIDRAARARGVGVFAAGNFSITATLLRRFALEAARHVADVEIIDYAQRRQARHAVGNGARARRGARRDPRRADLEAGRDALRHPRDARRRGRRRAQTAACACIALRLPSYVIAVEAVFGAESERLTIRHDAGSSAAPYVAGTLLAIRRVAEKPGLRRGLDALME